MIERFKTLFVVKSSLISLYLALTFPIPYISSDKLKIVSPDGKEKKLTLPSMKNLSLQEINSSTKGNIVLIPFMSSVSVKANVFFTNT